MALAKINSAQDMYPSRSPNQSRRATMEMTKTERIFALLLAIGALVCMSIDLGR
jgi:cell division protein FtsL